MLWKCHPGWMSGIRDLAQIFRGKNSDVKGEREKIRKLDKQWKEVILKNVFSSTKANTIWVDCVLPLLSVDLKINGYELWKQWPAGDYPRHFRDYAKNLNWAKESGKELFTNGLVQGFIRFSSVSE